MVTLRLRSATRFSWCSNNIKAKYVVGQILYRCDLARRGRLEKVAIKRVLLNPRPGIPYAVLYKDTLNSIHNERDLCTEAEALARYQEWKNG